MILNDGGLLYFCSSKCKRNHALKRDSRKLNWVKREKKSAGISEESAEKVGKPEEKPEEKPVEEAKEAKESEEKPEKAE